MNYDIGLCPATIFSRVAFLDVVFFTLSESGRLQHTLKHEFSPISLRFAGTLERARQVFGVLS